MILLFTAPENLSSDELSVSVNISSDDSILVQIILNASVKAITGPRKPDEYDVSVNLINVNSLQAMNVSNCPSIAGHSNDASSVALTLLCDIQPNELCTFNITASNRAGRSLIFKNGNFSKSTLELTNMSGMYVLLMDIT